jgi:hypothetical protein
MYFSSRLVLCWSVAANHFSLLRLVLSLGKTLVLFFDRVRNHLKVLLIDSIFLAEFVRDVPCT